MDKATFSMVLAELDKKTRSLPPTAQVAQQQGAYLAASFNHLSRNKRTTTRSSSEQDVEENIDSFTYQDNGMMAYIGDEVAVMSYGGKAYVASFGWLPRPISLMATVESVVRMMASPCPMAEQA
jgi:NADH dehydrogenase FAD-containing subunit